MKRAAIFSPNMETNMLSAVLEFFTAKAISSNLRIDARSKRSHCSSKHSLKLVTGEYRKTESYYLNINFNKKNMLQQKKKTLLYFQLPIKDYSAREGI